MATNVEIIKQLVEANTESFYVLVQAVAEFLQKNGIFMYVPGNYDVSPEDVREFIRDPEVWYKQVGYHAGLHGDGEEDNAPETSE